MSETLAAKATSRIRNIRSNLAVEISRLDRLGEGRRVKCKHKVFRRLLLIISTKGNSLHCYHTLIAESFKDFILCAFQQIFFRDHAPNGVERSVWRYCDFVVSYSSKSEEGYTLLLVFNLDKEVSRVELLCFVRFSYRCFQGFCNKEWGELSEW
ncbi:unnamed protein product [Ixodes persulcatus]